MSYLVQLVFAALAVALVVAFIVLKRNAAAPRPDERAEAEAPARRRQLQSFVEQERQAEGMEAAAIAPEAAAQPLPEPANETGLEDKPYSGHQPNLDQAVMGRLEAAFEALQAGEITLEAYRERIRAEEAALDRRIAVLGAEAGGPDLDAALAAQESVRWCLNWADEQAGGASG